MIDYINKMRGVKPPVKEALRTPSVRTATVQMVSYGPATTVGEEVARRFKTSMLPAVTNLCAETEGLYNMYSSSHDDDDGVDKQKKELKPVEDLYNALMKAQDVILNFVAKRKKELTNEAVESAPVDQEMGTESRLAVIIQKIASRDDMDQILGIVEEADAIAEVLESALETHESSLSHEAEKKDY